MLETIDIESAAAPDAAVIWLHGLGADGHDFEPIVPEILPRSERAWRFIFPHAPVRAVTLNGGAPMRAWYDIRRLDRAANEDLAGFKDTDAKLRELIAREESRGIPANRIVLGGFSQGGAVSLYSGLRCDRRLAGLMALSCYLPLASSLAAERAPANESTPIFMAHGLEDNVLAAALGRESRDVLLSLGYRVEWRDYPMAHTVCGAEIAAIREFLIGVLG